MANPVLNQRTIQRQTAWAPPAVAPDVARESRVGPTSSEAMTVRGAISKTGLLMLVLLAMAVVGWNISSTAPQADDGSTVLAPSMLIMVIPFVGLGIVGVLYFKPHLARYLAPVYAVVQGVFVGAISRYYEAAYDGIVVQAIGTTIAVFLAMLVLYSTRIVRVTQRFRSIVISATIGLMAFYGLSFVLRLFGVSIPFLSDASLLGIGFSVFAAGLAAANLLLDFDIIERGAAQRFNKDFEWYAAFGLLVTIVWLYLELLRLLRRLSDR